MIGRSGSIRWLAAALCLCLCLTLGLARATAEEAAAKAQDITKNCTFKVSEGDRGKLKDGNVRTSWSYDRSGAYVGVKLPSGVSAGWLRIEWLFDPTGFDLIEYDESVNLLRQRN